MHALPRRNTSNAHCEVDYKQVKKIYSMRFLYFCLADDYPAIFNLGIMRK